MPGFPLPSFQPVRFSVGGTLADISLWEPIDGFVYSRDNGETFDTLTVGGSFGTSAPSAFEARIMDGATEVVTWTTVDASPAGTTWTGTIEVPQGGDYTIEARNADDTAINAASSSSFYVGLGAVVVYGQSNAEDLWQNTLDTPVSAAAGTWFRYEDLSGNDVAGAPSSSLAISPFLNELNTLTSLPVSGVGGGAAGTPASGLVPGQAPFIDLTEKVSAHGQDISAIVYKQGENDATAFFNKTTYFSEIASIHTGVAALVGKTAAEVPLVIGTVSATTSGITDDNWMQVVDAQIEYCDDVTNNAFLAEDTPDVDLIDSFHYSGETQAKLGKRYAYAISRALRFDTTNHIFRMASARVTNATTTVVNLTHGLGTDFTPTTGIAGFEVSTDGTTWVSATGARTDASTITLTHASTAGVTKVRYLYGANHASRLSPVTDNGTYSMTLLRETIDAAAEITTASQTSVTDPITGHVYSFVASDGTTPEARTVWQYQDGTWGVLGGSGNDVRIGSITPVSTSVSTSAYTVPDNLDDTAATGAQTRWMHGTMVNPWQGQAPNDPVKVGFDSYYGSNTGGEANYAHSANEDPGKTGAALVVTEGSVVKSESLTTEGGHTNTAADRTRTEAFSCLTVAPEIPVANSFRPPIRGTDKKSYWTTDQMDIAGTRQIISGFTPWTTGEIDTAEASIKYIQNTFIPWQEPARRWNPGARGGGVDIYGNDWYGVFDRFFGAYHGDYTEAEIEDITKAVIQVGIDLYGLMTDNSFMYPYQAHHAGRKGIMAAAGFILNDANILAQLDADAHPEHFGVDDAYCGYITADMVGTQPNFYKGAYPYVWESVQIGQPEWASNFALNGATVEDNEQVTDPDIARRSYQVLSFDNGAMMQCLWGMIMDPGAQYYKPAYFDFADRYLAIRFGDQIDGVWDASSDLTGTNGHFTGNWWSINPSDTLVGYFKEMRDASSRPSYVPNLIPEALPKPTVTHDGSSDHLDVDFNTNNFRCPQDKDVTITGYDLRWTAYAGDGENITVESDDANIVNFEWNVIEDVTIPYELHGVPRNEKVKIQLRMKNTNGPGPWLDDRYREAFNSNAVFVGLNGTDAAGTRYSTNFDVPDLAVFDTVPQNFKIPSASPSSVVTGGTLTADDGIWTDTPTVTATNYQWQVSDDGSTGWADISGATSSTYVATASEEGKFIRVGVSKTNSAGTSAVVYSATGIPASAPAVNVGPLLYGSSATTHDPGFGALGGKQLLICWVARENAVITNIGGTIGGYSFGASEVVASQNTGTSGGARERSFTYLVTVTGGETATEITMSQASLKAAIVVFELTTPMTFNAATIAQSTDSAASVATVSGGAAFFLGRGDTSITINSSPDFTLHADNASNSPNAAAAYALSTAAGTAELDVTVGFNTNSIYQIISLAP